MDNVRIAQELVEIAMMIVAAKPLFDEFAY